MSGKTAIPGITLDIDAILLKADASPMAMTMQSSLSGIAYAISKDGGVLILEKHGFLGRRIEDMRVIHEELGYVLEEAERWQRS